MLTDKKIFLTGGAGFIGSTLIGSLIERNKICVFDNLARNTLSSKPLADHANVVVENRCKIQNNVSFYDGVTLEDDVFCGPSCVFTNIANPRAHLSRKTEFRPTRPTVWPQRIVALAPVVALRPIAPNGGG